MSDELGRSDVINVEKLKEVTGDTPLSFRSLFKDHKRKFQHFCTLILNSNCFPRFDFLDNATKNRLCLIPCERQFKENPNEQLTEVDCLGHTFKKQIKRDLSLAQRLLSQDGLNALFHIL